MNRLVIIGSMALLMPTGVALAQTTSSESSTTVTPSLAAPPAGTLSTTRTQKSIGPDGTQTRTNESTYRNSDGVADDTVRTTTTPPPAPVTTTRKTTTTVTQ